VTSPPAPPADPPAQSLGELADRQAKVETKLDELIGLVKGAVTPGDGKPASQPAPDDSLEARVQDELARRDRDAADATRAQEHASLKATVAKLAEKPPRQPVTRRSKLLGWGDGRG
jgi:hypothetical protein